MPFNIVNGEGSPNAKIAFVGEAPGLQEERAGRPFVGPAGQKLTEVMHLVGIPRSECYITNVVKEHPPGDDFTKFIKFDRKGGVYPTPEYNRYIDMLKIELFSLPDCNVIVPLGGQALYALTGKFSITKWRGSTLPSTLIPGKKVIPTIHPSAALRQYIYTHFMRIDLVKVLRESQSPALNLPQREILIKPSFSDACAYLEQCKEAKILGVDIEVVNEEVSCISIAQSWNRIMSIPFISKGYDYFSPEQEYQIWHLVASLLEDISITKVGQNFLFDCSFLYRRYGIKTINVEDTMIGMGVAYPDFPKGLDFITSLYTNEPYYKDDGKKWFKFGGSETDFWIYNAKDSAVCIESIGKIINDVTKQDNLKTYVRQRSLIGPLMYMQERGMRVDVDGLKGASYDSESKINKLLDELYIICGFELNPNSPQQLIKYFYHDKKIKPYMKDGHPTTDDIAMRRLARSGIKEAQLIRDIRKLRKLKGTYFDIKISNDNRLRTAFKPVGTKTGRLSSGEDIFGEGGNVQNLPEVFRYFILPDEGYVLYNVDLSQAENRIVSYIAPEPIMRESFETGIDVHRRTSSLILGKPMEMISDEPGSSTLGTGEYSERFWGKKANHGLNYDLGYKSFALYYDMKESEAKFIVERYHQAYPGIRQYHAWVKAKLAKDRRLVNCMGRVRIFLDRWGDSLFKEAYAQIPQSTVADVINERGMNYIYYNQEEYDIFSLVELLNQVHDSIIFQIPLSAGWEYHARALIAIKKKLETPLRWHDTEFVIPADVSMCNTLGKKDMKGVKFNVSNTTIEGLARQLHDLYEQYGTSKSVQTMDGYISDSILFAEEMQSALGNDADLP